MNTSGITKDKIEYLIKEIGAYYDINLSDILSSNSMSHNITTHEIGIKLFDAYNLYMTNKIELSYIILGKLLVLDNNVRYDIKDFEKIQKISKYLLFASSEYKIFCDWYDNYKEIWNCYVDENPLRVESDEANKYEPTYLYDLDKNLFGKYGILKEYVYKKGVEKLNLTTYQINNTFVYTNDLSLYINSLTPKKDEITYFSMIFNIQEILEISYFVIIVQYKDYIWVFDDSTTFANPESAVNMSARNFRFRESSWEKFPISYDNIVNKLIALRENKLAKSDKNFELYTENIAETWSTEDKDNFRFMIDLLFPRLYDVSNEAMFLFDHINYNQKAIGTNKSEDINDKFSKVNYDECMRHFNDILVDKKPVNKNKSIVKLNSSNICVSDTTTNALMTANEFAKITAWHINTEKKKKIEDALNDINEESDIKDLRKIILKNKDEIYKRCITTKKIIIADEETPGSLFFESKSLHVIVINPVVDYETLCFSDINLKNDKLYKGYVLKSTCSKCDVRKNNDKENTIKIHHFAQLMYYLGIDDRTKLPKSFMNFKSDQFIPYAGNTILDNVNPIFKIRNDFNYKHRNGFNLKLGLCRICERRFERNNSSIFCAVINKQGKLLREYTEEEYNKEIKSQKRIII